MHIYKLSKVDTHKEIIIYGTGEIAKRYYQQIISDYNPQKVVYFLETRPSKSSIFNLKIISLEDLATLNIEKFTFLLTSKAGNIEMVNNLTKLGVPKENIIVPRDLELQKLIPQKQIYENFDLYPLIESEEDFNDLLLKLSWFFPSDSTVKNRITIFAKKTLTNIKRNLGEYNISNNICIQFEDKIEWNNNLNSILIWNVDNFEELPVEKRAQTFVIDKNYFKNIDITNLIRLYCFSIPIEKRELYFQSSVEKFSNMDFTQYHKGTLFAPGPSVIEAYSHNFEDSYNVICNSVVKNKKLVNHIKPNLITFADNVAHFSESIFSREFRENVVNIVREFKADILIPRDFMPLLCNHFPELLDSTIGIETKTSEEFNFPTADSFWIKNTGNIATKLMIPFVSSVINNISMFGFDGRSNNISKCIHKTQIWEYSKSSHEETLANELYSDYPAYFKGVQDDYYYDLHSNMLGDLLEYGEKVGKKYINRTNSNFPCLASRYISK